MGRDRRVRSSLDLTRDPSRGKRLCHGRSNAIKAWTRSDRTGMRSTRWVVALTRRTHRRCLKSHPISANAIKIIPFRVIAFVIALAGGPGLGLRVAVDDVR